MSVNYQWNISQIEEAADTLKNYIDNLTKLKERYATIPQEISEAWSDFNAENFNVIIENDVEKYSGVLELLEEIQLKLKNAKIYYEEAENKTNSLAKEILSQTGLDRLIK